MTKTILLINHQNNDQRDCLLITHSLLREKFIPCSLILAESLSEGRQLADEVNPDMVIYIDDAITIDEASELISSIRSSVDEVIEANLLPFIIHTDNVLLRGLEAETDVGFTRLLSKPTSGHQLRRLVNDMFREVDIVEMV